MSAPRRELALSALVAVTLWALSFSFDLFDRLHALMDTHPSWHVEDFVVTVLMFSVWLTFVAYRKSVQVTREAGLRRAAEADAFRSGRFDTLTGLPNRVLFQEEAGRALGAAWERGSKCAVLFLDLDGFKPVNDTFGHAVGDELLGRVANLIRECAPETALVARMGGDEFCVLIEFSAGDDTPVLAARRLLRCLHKPIAIAGQEVRIGATVGVAIGPRDGRRAEELIHAADLAMYQGKRSGRGTVRLFESAA